MIWDSQPWKQSLIRDAVELSKLRFEPEDVDVEIAFEKLIFVTAFAIRKLLEAMKLTDRVNNLDVKCSKLRLIDTAKVPDHMNWHRVDEFYSIQDAKKATVKLRFFVNQVIHSFIFIPTVNEDETAFHGFFVATDKDRRHFLYSYEISELIRIMGIVGNDEVVSTQMKRDDKWDWQIKNDGVKDVKPKRNSRE